MDTKLILDFIAKLEQNNNKEWFEANRKEYETARKEFIKIVEGLLDRLKKEDGSLEGLAAKDCMFRINRDVRFSKDKSPYKTNFGAAMSSGGKKSVNASYYIHLQPGGRSFLGGGIYMPEPEVLKKIRQEIDYKGDEFLKIISNPPFKKYFENLEGDKLKTVPKGYTADHPMIEYLKLKSYTVWHSYKDNEVSKGDFAGEAAERFKLMKPFITFLNVAVS
jgi:uncharacterized protein (TIGR02453 family)